MPDHLLMYIFCLGSSIGLGLKVADGAYSECFVPKKEIDNVFLQRFTIRSSSNLALIWIQFITQTFVSITFFKYEEDANWAEDNPCPLVS